MGLHLTILSPFGVLFDDEVKYVYIPAANGPIGILPGHTPFIGRISERGGVVRFETMDSKECFYAAKNGAAEVKIEKTILLFTEFKKCDSLEEAVSLYKEIQPKEEKTLKETDIKVAEALSKRKN